ncbi:MAG: acetylornithine deacetylase [Acidiferrobacterales bacterium]|nr:acetylornithine deacetylase [Acidiferrobacterales bacterium]
MATSKSSIDLITDLVGFDTTSRNSNLELIEFVKGYLEQFGISSELVFDRDRRKANLFATIGAADLGGVALSGHTDVVPVDGQKWETDPYRIDRKDDRLFGRGTSDMKSFIAVCLAKVPQMIERNLATPIHFAFSYDEEIGCVGVRTLLRELEQRPNKPRLCVIGEPTGMRVVRAHKGKISRRCTIHGLEAHSGLAHIGVNAVEAAAEIIAFLKRRAREFRDEGPFDHEFDPPYTTVHTGTVKGGTALNIVPKLCAFEAEIRHLPNDDPDRVWDQLQKFIENDILPEMNAVYPDASIEWEELSVIPALSTSDDSLIRMTQELSHTTGTGCVSFGTEGGLFENIGIPSVVCGPGYIDQAHKPNEYIEVSQVQKCEQFVDNLLARLS